jgi:hypothetical protein
MAEKGMMSFTRIACGVFMIDTAPDVLPRAIASYLIRGGERGSADRRRLQVHLQAAVEGP